MPCLYRHVYCSEPGYSGPNVAHRGALDSLNSLTPFDGTVCIFSVTMYWSYVYPQNGDGYVDSEAKLKKITDAIAAKLK